MSKNTALLHTDLVLELQEELKEEETEKNGIVIKRGERKEGKIKEVIVKISNKKGETLLGKPQGTYITLEMGDLSQNDGEYHKEMSHLFAEHMERLVQNDTKILFAGLGNRNVTPDALGPFVMENLFITNHLGEVPFFQNMRESMAVMPGVMAQTGIETGEVLKGIIDRERPDVLVVVDALAAKNAERLNRTIQICDTGISPGAGVKNKRKEISRKTMGIPVIAVGVPTVISIPAIAGDIMESLSQILHEEKWVRQYAAWSDREKYQFMAEVLPKELYELFVTPKEIDESIRRISYTISEGLNQIIAKKPEKKKRHNLSGQA